MTIPLAVLLVEDSERDAELVLALLEESGYAPGSRRVATAQDLEAALTAQDWDLIIADHSMPAFGSGDALRRMKERGLDLPFIIVSGAIGEDVAVAAMKAGAHDYIMKDNLTRLIPAIQRELREAEERQRRRSLERERAQLAAIVESSEDAIIGKTLEGIITSWNRGAERLYGYRADEVMGQSVTLLVPEDRPEEMPRLLERIQRGESVEPYETVRVRKDGQQISVSLSISPVRAPDGTTIGASAIARDITRQKAVEGRLRYQALHDALTGLPNRVLFIDRLEQAMLHADRQNTKAALLLMDLDRFKEINDTLGHQAGDSLLQQFAARLLNRLRASDTVVRLGGDEFAVVLPETDLCGALGAMNKIQAALTPPFSIEREYLDIAASLGIALYPDHGGDAATLLRRADVAMYTAKRDHTGYALYVPSADAHSLRRLTLTTELARAIDGEQLLLHYQPLYSASSGSLDHLEALVRWRHPVRGLIPPQEFIPMAEETGLIHPLTRWVLRSAFKQVESWHAAGKEFEVSVNFSARNLHDRSLPDTIAGLILDTGLRPGWFTMEITESALMADPDRAMEILTALHDMGLRLSIDDFGTGYSSLAYLGRLPADELKIDRSFIVDMKHNSSDSVIVKAIIDLGHSLGLTVVAEGVENYETFQTLTALGCDIIQGYHLAPPLSAADVTSWSLSHSA